MSGRRDSFASRPLPSGREPWCRHFRTEGEDRVIRITILDCGSTFVDEAMPLSNRSKNPRAFTGIGRKKRHQIEVPVTAYLIEHPNALILVDTGWDTMVRENA